jgi:hypothetical protein
MIFQVGKNSYDITLICISSVGVILLVGYAGFAYLVTHSGDFYHVRRWKASLWFASIFGIILSALLIIFSIRPIISSAVERNTFEVIKQVIGMIFTGLTLIIPFLFVVTIGTHHQLKWWLNSDDYLDKVWKDPSKGHKNPIQEL